MPKAQYKDLDGYDSDPEFYNQSSLFRQSIRKKDKNVIHNNAISDHKEIPK